MADNRDIKLPAGEQAIRQEILDSVKDENQRRLLESTMQSEAWKLAELVLRNSELELEHKRLATAAAEGKRASAERKKLREKLAAAEKALHTATRVADKERNARQVTEEQLAAVVYAVREANEGESRLDRLVKKIDEEHGRD
jgi:hypothetical protein